MSKLKINVKVININMNCRRCKVFKKLCVKYLLMADCNLKVRRTLTFPRI